MRRMKRSAAITTPTLTATTRSTKTVSPNVTSSTIRSERGARRSRRPKWRTSHIVQATKKRMAASAASGTCEAKGANSTMTSTRKTECTMPASGLVAPLRTLVAVRAIAPVAAKPPNTGVSTFATPWPISSWFGLCRVPVMPSTTTAVSSDSMAPSSAIANAGPTSWMTSVTPISGHWSEGRVRGMPPNSVPIVATPGNWKRHLHRGRGEHRDERRRNAPEARDAIEQPVAGHHDRERKDRDARGRGMKCRQRLHERPELAVEMGVGRDRRQPEEVLPLADEDDDGDAGREADDDRVRDEADDAAELAGRP